ncbi:MAG: YraN family protein [Ferruginibacter sp.]
MAAHNEKGKLGEQLAVDYFSNLGYEIMYQNWRHRHWEVDIIASKKNMLHFIEVKCRSSAQYGFPEEAVSLKKIKHLIDASAEFLFQFPQWKRIQFDVLSIHFLRNGEAEYFLIEDVYL